VARRTRSAGRRRFTLSAAVIAAIVLLAGAGVMLFLRVGAEGPVSTAGDDAAASAAEGAAGPYNAVSRTLRRVGLMWDAAERIEALEAENRELQYWRRAAERLAERNARYAELLRMAPDAFGENADLENAIGARLVLDSGGPFTRTLVADAGADRGVRVGYIAVNHRGLVGRVVSVGRTSARILMLDDYNSRVPVMGAQSRVRAMLVGRASNPPNLVAAPFSVEDPALEFFAGGLRQGEPIITSGDGGLYPRGIRVGVASRRQNGDWRVELAVSGAPIDFVRLVPFIAPVTPESEGVAPDEGPAFAPPRARVAGAAPPPRPRPQPAAQPAAPPPAPAPAQAPPQ
jgi:rod shape-determining protein MreC